MKVKEVLGIEDKVCPICLNNPNARFTENQVACSCLHIQEFNAVINKELTLNEFEIRRVLGRCADDSITTMSKDIVEAFPSGRILAVDTSQNSFIDR